MSDTGSCEESFSADDKKSRGISVDAVPFTPRGKSTSSVLSPLAPEFYPRNYIATNKNEVVTTNNTVAHSIAEIRRIVTNLVQQPGDYDHLMAPLVESLTSNVHDVNTLIFIVENLVSESICDPSFHYTGARICWYLCQHLKFPFGSFEEHLFQRCEAECLNLCFNVRTDESTKGSLSHLIGFTFFMAELLFSIKDSSESQFLRELPNRVVDLILKLVDIGTAESVQNAVKVLKLIGAILESNEVDLSMIFARLQECTLDSELTRFMISGVTAQRAASWGQGESDIITTAGAGDTNNSLCTEASVHSSDGSVYYDANSQSFTVPETVEEFDSFIDWPSSNGNSVNADNNVQYWIGDEVMDSETATAFEEFIAGNDLRPIPSYWCYQP